MFDFFKTILFLLLFLTVFSCKKATETLLNDTHYKYYDSISVYTKSGDSVKLKQIEKKIKTDFSSQDALKNSYLDLIKLLRYQQGYTYDNIYTLSWEPIALLKKHGDEEAAIYYAFQKCNALFYLNKGKEMHTQLDIYLKMFQDSKSCIFPDLSHLKATMYMVDNRYIACLDELKKTKKYLFQNDCHDLETNIYVDMSYIYYRLNQKEEGLKAAQNALKSASNNDKMSLGYIAVAKAYLELDSFNLALPHVEKAFKLVDQNNENMINYYKTIFLRTHTELGNHREVDSLYQNIKSFDQLFGFHRYLFHRYYAKSLMKIGDYPKAQKIYNLALLEIPEDHMIEERAILKEISDLHKDMKLYSESLRYLAQYSQLENEFFEAETKNRISDQTVLLQVAEKEAALELAKRKTIEQNLSIAKKNKTIALGSVITISLLLLTIVFIYFNKRVKRKNIELASEKEKVELTNQALTSALYEKSLLMKEIHHRVKNHLQFLMCILRVQSRAKDLSIEEFVDKSNARLTAIASIHQQLYEISTEEPVSLMEYILKLSSDLKKIRDVAYDFTIESQPTHIYVSHQLAVSIGLILNELISNSYKYAFSENNNFIKVKLYEQNEHIYIDYQDSGNGSFDEIKNSKNSGLSIIKLLALQIKANINFSKDYSHASLNLSKFDSKVPY